MADVHVIGVGRSPATAFSPKQIKAIGNRPGRVNMVIGWSKHQAIADIHPLNLKSTHPDLV